MMDNLLESVKLKEIALIGDGAHASLKRENSGILYLTSKNFKQDGISLDTVDYISEETYQKYFKEKSKALTKPRENDILLSIIGTMGAPYIVKKDDIFGLSSSVSIIRPNNEIVDSKYLYYWIKSPMFQGSIESIKSGVAQSFLSLPMIGSLPIKYPKDLNHQKKIAKILSNYDDLIENNLKQIKLLEEKARLTYEEWFLRFRINGQKLEIDENTGLPFRWEKQRLESLIDYHIGGGWGEEEQSDEFSKPAFVIRGTDFNNVQVGSLENVPYRYHKLSNLSSRNLKHKDIIFEVSGGSSTEGVAKTLQLNRILLDQFDNQVMCASFCKLVRTKSEDYSNLLFLFLQYLRYTRETEVYELRGASNIVNYNWSAFLKFQEIIISDIKTIKLFNLKIDPIIDSIYNFAKKNQLLKESRDILLPRLMTGMIDVDKMDIEV